MAPAPAGHGEDQLQFIVRIILEDLAVTGDIDQTARLDLLSAIDAVPVGYRAELARDVLDWLAQVADVQDEHMKWWFRRMAYHDRPYLLFGAASRHKPSVQDMFNEFVALRHQQQLELTPELSDRLTVGVLLTPRHDGVRPWDTTAVATKGWIDYRPKYREAMELLWGPPDSTMFPEPDMDRVAAAFREADEEAEAEAD